MTQLRFVSTLRSGARGGAACELDFDVKDVFGRARAPVRATINGYSFETTTIAMGGVFYLGVNKAHQAGARVRPGDTFEVLLELDEAPRFVNPPSDLAEALAASAPARAAWDALSYTHQKEHVQSIEGAKRPETRARRLARTIASLRPARKK